MTAAPLRFGVLGTGRIARGFCAGLAGSDRVRIQAVASRHGDRAREFAAALGIPRGVGSYEALLAEPDCDAIYVALPNSLHGPWAIRALESGRHVLCEKPLAVSAAEARRMFAAARAAGRWLVEAYPFRSQPQTHKVRELLRSGTIGRPRFVQAHFSFQLASDHDIRLDPSLGGGALMDVGCYCLSLIRMVAGGLPTQVSAVAQWTSEHGVDRTLAGTLEFPDGLIAQLSCSIGAALERRALIVGSDGVLQTSFFNHPPTGGPSEVLIRVGRDTREPWQSVPVPSMNGFLAEAEDFERLVRQGPGHWSGIPEDESVDVALLIETLLESARSGRALSP